jgi:hypothetical protein
MAAALVLWRILQWPILLESPGLFGKIAWCRIEKEDYSIVVCWFGCILKGVEANARPGRYAGVIAGTESNLKGSNIS